MKVQLDMGIEYEDMRTILQCLKKLKNKNKLLILGDAVIHFTSQQYAQLAKEENFKLPTVPNTLNPFSLGESLGFQTTETLDINGKTTLNVDLTKTIPKELIGQYDCIIDGGVLFWCFEPGTALRNIYSLANKGAVLIHITAISGYYGRGYYSIQPRLFEDFYLGNKAKFLVSTYRTKFRNKNCCLKNILSRFVKFKNKNYVSVSNESGNIFLSQNREGQYGFTKKLPDLDTDFIPNNFTGIQAFQKCSTAKEITENPYNLNVPGL